MRYSLRFLVDTLFYVLILLGLAAYAEEAVKPSPTLAKEEKLPDPPGILRLNTDMHTARINHIAVDAKEQYLVTGSHDKTARVWSLPDGKLLRVLRPPIGDGDEGKVYAVAISPDGKTVAVGGWTDCNEKGKSCSIYLFDRATGELQRRLSGLPSGIAYLAYSSDGQYLVTSLGGRNGIRIYETAQYTQVAQDREYGDISVWAEFDQQGRLVTSSCDGFVRLYDSQFQLRHKEVAPGGERPFAVRFSPDGNQIAVSFHDTTQINVLSGQDLTPRYSPDTRDVTDGNLMSVAWSADGHTVYAGGRYDNDNGMNLILSWADAGQGKRQSWVAASNSIMDIRALATGDIVFVAGDPAFGQFSAQGKKQFWPAEIAVFQHIFEGTFRLSQTGDRLQFSYERGGKKPMQFSVRTPAVLMSPTASKEDLAPRTQSAQLTITDWEDTPAPKLNGTRLLLKPYEMSRSLAITPDDQQFLLGTEWYLRLFDQQGRQQWKVPVPDAAWGVNIAGNGQVAVAALGDGTLRWYRLRDGQELLALFPHNDQKRWIMWTPQSYYDASPGAEHLIGWHINQGPDKAAQFITLGERGEEFRRPDVLSKILDTLDVTEALKQANAERVKRDK